MTTIASEPLARVRDTSAELIVGSALTGREVSVLTLLAEGLDTREIAERLCYSERTVKNVIHTITSRLMVRNRAHAVAFAVRHQLI